MAELRQVPVTERVRCALCKDVTRHATREEAVVAGWRHYEQAHTANPPVATVQQLPGVTFHEQALMALKALARTGRKFTVGEAHPMVSTPAPNPRTDWETAPVEAWYQRDLDVMRHCHAVVRLPGESTGADAEVAEAERIGLPIYTWPSGSLCAFIGEWTA